MCSFQTSFSSTVKVCVVVYFSTSASSEQMSDFDLVPVDGGDPIHLPPGETVVGRGPFLRVSPPSYIVVPQFVLDYMLLLLNLTHITYSCLFLNYLC